MNKPLDKTPALAKFIQYSLPVFIIGIISRTFPVISLFYYIVPVLLAVYTIIGIYLLHRSDLKLKRLSIIFSFPIYCLITSAWSDYPLMTLSRALYLILMYAGILSVVFILIKYFPKKGIDYFLPSNILVVIISVISLILGIPEDLWSGGNGLGFMGFAGHQNTLASAILFTLPGVIALGMKLSAKSIAFKTNAGDRNQNKKTLTGYQPSIFNTLMLLLLLTANCLMILLTYSRASMLSLIIGILTFLIITKSKKILAVVFSLSCIILVLYFTIQPINITFNKWVNKDGGNILDRRIILWEPSFEAAKLGGILGLGYGVSAPEIKTPELTGSHYEDGRYIREKGSSILAVIEETGFVGLILFLLPLIYILLNSFRIKYLKFTNHHAILISALVSLLIHAQFEAWWVGPGSIQFPIFLIIVFSFLPYIKKY
jgi:hypothetical protein